MFSFSSKRMSSRTRSPSRPSASGGIQRDIEDLYSIQKKIRELEDKESELKTRIILYMGEHKIERRVYGKLDVKCDTRYRSTVSKEDLPPDIWEKHKHTVQFKVLSVKLTK